MLGRIVLDYIRILDDSHTVSMTITGVIPNPIDYYIYERKKMLKEETLELTFYFENQHQLALWVTAVQNNVTFVNLPKFDKKSFKVRNTSQRHPQAISKMKK